MAPTDRKYMESHEWALLDGEMVTVGITDFAVEHLSDLTFLDLPEPGTTLAKGDRFGEIESVKAVSELFSPVSGEVVEVNAELADDLDRLKEDAFGAGWMIRIKATATDELESMMDAATYEQKVAEES